MADGRLMLKLGQLTKLSGRSTAAATPGTDRPLKEAEISNET